MVAWGICTNKPLVVSSIPILVGNLLLYNVNNLILGYLHSYGIVLTVGEILTSTRQKSAVCPCRSILVACQPGNRWQPVAGAAGDFEDHRRTSRTSLCWRLCGRRVFPFLVIHEDYIVIWLNFITTSRRDRTLEIMVRIRGIIPKWPKHSGW